MTSKICEVEQMTNEKAIQLLRRLQDEQFDGIHGDERRQAMDMAIRAMEKPKTAGRGSLDSEQPEIKTDRTIGDCISRQQAIEAFEPTHYKDWYTPTIIETLETLPSVQQEIIACGSGELVQEPDGLVKDLVKDCISRKMAIDAINNCYCGGEDSCGEPWIYEDDAIKAVEQLPSAYPVNYGSTKSDSSSQLKLNNDLISRQAAIDIVRNRVKRFTTACVLAVTEIEQLPPAQPERKKGKCFQSTEKFDDDADDVEEVESYE